MAGRHFETNPDMRGMLTLFASYPVWRAIALQQEPAEKARLRLSEREREAFQWASDGKPGFACA